MMNLIMAGANMLIKPKHKHNHNHQQQYGGQQQGGWGQQGGQGGWGGNQGGMGGNQGNLGFISEQSQQNWGTTSKDHNGFKNRTKEISSNWLMNKVVALIYKI